MDKLLNWQQCCAILGCGKTFFYALIQSGELASVRLGARQGIRVRASDLQKFIRRHKDGLAEK